MKPYYPVLAFSLLLFACGKDETPEEPDPQPTVRPIELIAIVNNDSFVADKYHVSCAISGGMYQINATSDSQRIVIFFSDEPTVKKYEITQNFSANDVSVNWFEDELVSASNHKVNNGSLEVTSYNDGLIECLFSGKAQSITDSTIIVDITAGTLKAQFPN